MPVYETHNFTPQSLAELPGVIVQQAYNALDCCLTYEIFDRITEEHPANGNVIYDFARALQAPVLEMMLRGFKIDEYERAKAAQETKRELEKLYGILNEFAIAVWGQPLNPRSTQQLIKFFHTTMQFPERWAGKKGKSSISMDREALEALDSYLYARPIVQTILAIRDYEKRLQVFETEIDRDGRYRTSFNIAGTETGRFSSSKSQTGTGGNAQNISPKQRKIFVADQGYRLYGFDLEQAESREVGWNCGILFDEWSYYDAALAGDLHTIACRLIFDEIPWTGDLKKDKNLAEEPYYRHYSYRDMAKRGGHGSNYYGQPFTMARHLKVPKELMEKFQSRYFTAFPGIPLWHQHTARQLQTTRSITTKFGRTRFFFGRPNDDSTLREAIAFEPQSCTADRTNLILWRLWYHMGGGNGQPQRIQLLTQEHDAIYFQAREEYDPQALAAEALSHFHINITHKSGRTLIVPGECKVGWNKASYVGHEDVAAAIARGRTPPELNLDGLRKLKGPETRTRQTGLNRIL